MNSVGSSLKEARNRKKISLKKAAEDLHIKWEILEDLENSLWEKLPEPTYVKGILRSYAPYLGLDTDHMLALYRREFDEAKYPNKKSALTKEKRLMLTPNKVSLAGFLALIAIFVVYLLVQYASFLNAPKLEIFSPSDDLTTTVPLVKITGKTEKDTTVAIEGNFVPIDADGNFNYEYKLKDGRNEIEILASKKLSPKTRVQKIVRLAK